MTDPELKSVAAQVKKLTARVEALERLPECIFRQKPVSKRQLEKALQSRGVTRPQIRRCQPCPGAGLRTLDDETACAPLPHAKVRRNAKSGERMPRFFMSAFDWTTVGDVSSAIRASSSWGMEHDLSETTHAP
jgi:hypothetical protein